MTSNQIGKKISKIGYYVLIFGVLILSFGVMGLILSGENASAEEGRTIVVKISDGVSTSDPEPIVKENLHNLQFL